MDATGKSLAKKTYVVTIGATGAYAETYVEVKAETKTQAEQLALAQIEEASFVEWCLSDGEPDGPLEILGVEEK